MVISWEWVLGITCNPIPWTDGPLTNGHRLRMVSRDYMQPHAYGGSSMRGHNMKWMKDLTSSVLYRVKWTYFICWTEMFLKKRFLLEHVFNQPVLTWLAILHIEHFAQPFCFPFSTSWGDKLGGWSLNDLLVVSKTCHIYYVLTVSFNFNKSLRAQEIFWNFMLHLSFFFYFLFSVTKCFHNKDFIS